MSKTKNRESDVTGSASGEVEKLQLMIELHRENGTLTARETGVLREISRQGGTSFAVGGGRGNMGSSAWGWTHGGITSGEMFPGRGISTVGSSELDVERNRLLERIESVLLQNRTTKKELV